MRRFVASAALLLSCRDPTEITIELSTDEPCEVASAQGTNITAGGRELPDDKAPGARTTSCANGNVGTMVLLPGGSLDDAVSVRVVMGVHRSAAECTTSDGGALDYDGCIVARRSLRYLPHTRLTLPIALRAVCEGKACPGQTCVQGQCVDPTLRDPSRCIDEQACGEQSLLPPDAGPPPPDAGFDASPSGAPDSGADAEGGPGPVSCLGSPSASTGACTDADSRLTCLSCCQVCQPQGLAFYSAVWPCACSAGLCTTADCTSATSCNTNPSRLETACTDCLLSAAKGSCGPDLQSCVAASACTPFVDCTGFCL